MRCEHIRDELPGLASGELTAALEAEVRAHTETCEGCRRLLLEMTSTVELLRSAPLEHRPPPDLTAEVFAFLELEPVAHLASEAPLEHTPPVDLERRSLEHSGVLERPRPTRWQRASTLLAPALAAAALLFGFAAVQWRNEANEARSDAAQSERRETVASFVLAGSEHWPDVPAELIKMWDGAYSIGLHLQDYPTTKPGEYCAMWLVNDRGRRVSAVTFPVPDVAPNDWWVWTPPLGVDPSDYHRVEVTLVQGEGAEEESFMILQGDIQL